MAEKKKTTTPKSGAKSSSTKKTTVKSKSVAKKSVTKKSTAKKVAPKKTAPKNTGVKKTAAKKSSAAKTTVKTPKVVTAASKSAEPKPAISYMDWENVVKGTFKAFPKLWWRIGLVNVTSLILIILSFALSAGVVLAGFGGISSFENALANLKFGLGYDANSMIALGIGIFVFFNLLIVVSVLGKVTSFLVVKNYLESENKNPLVLYFKDSWAYFWRYLLLGLYVTWYIVWPMLVFLLAISVIGVSSDMLDFPDFVTIPLIVLLSFLMFGYFVFRAFQMFFYQTVLVHSNANTSESFKLTLSLVKGNWWRVFGAAFVFFALAWVVQMFLNIPSIIAEFTALSEVLIIGSSLLDFIFSFFILAPISATFMYFLMLQVAKNKNIELS